RALIAESRTETIEFDELVKRSERLLQQALETRAAIETAKYALQRARTFMADGVLARGSATGRLLIRDDLPTWLTLLNLQNPYARPDGKLVQTEPYAVPTRGSKGEQMSVLPLGLLKRKSLAEPEKSIPADYTSTHWTAYLKLTPDLSEAEGGGVPPWG